MLSKPEILVLALTGAQWGPCLPGTCWGLELWGTNIEFEKQLPGVWASAQTPNTCVGGPGKDQEHFKDLILGQIIGSLPVLRFSLHYPAAPDCSVCQIKAEPVGDASTEEEGSGLVWRPHFVGTVTPAAVALPLSGSPPLIFILSF